MAKIQNREATIKTVSVEIKALTVSGKQVTQALFKQLEARPLIDRATLTLRGIPWGRVNYHVGCNEYTREHLHIVWQEGDQLRRDCVEHSQIAGIIHERLEYPDPWWWTALLCEVLEEVPFWNDTPVTEIEPYKIEDRGTINTTSLMFEDATSGFARDLRKYWIGGELPGWEDENKLTPAYKEQRLQQSQAEAKTAIQARLRKAGARGDWEDQTSETALHRWRQIRAQHVDWNTRWGKLWHSLCDLDQLFIAV